VLANSLGVFARDTAPVIEVFGCIIVLVLLAARYTRRQRLWRIAALIMAAALGSILGSALAYGDQGLPGIGVTGHFRLLLRSSYYCGFSWAGVLLWILHERDIAALTALRAERERLANLGRELAEAQLQVLKAQVEPHFLFNTLAHVRRLYATRPELARVLLVDLRRYISALHPVLQHASIPLGDDAGYAQAYLRLQQLRMGERLRFLFDLDPVTLHLAVPPMTVTTLVENAVKHGLAEATAGGNITVRAAAQGGALLLTVSDDGTGLTGGHGAGVGLANLRARLHSLHGVAASLELQQRPAGGVIATVRLPLSGSGNLSP
jgi:LytS/YehU family sensor histidine kinase